MATPQNDSYIAPEGQLFAGRLQVRPLGIAPENAMGVPSITRVVTVDPEGPPLAIISPVGIATSLAFGTPTVRDPAVSAPPDIYRPLNLGRLVVFTSYLASSRYERFQRSHILDNVTESVSFRGTDISEGGGGANLTLLASSYTLLVDNVAIATAAPQASKPYQGTFTFSTESLSEGWHVFDIVCHGSETAVPWVMYVKKGGPLYQPYIPVCYSSYEIGHIGTPAQKIVWVRSDGRPTPRPLVPREAPAFSTALSRSQLHLEDVVPRSSHHRLNINEDGIISSMDRMSYFFSDLVKKIPDLPLLDGPRGVGTLQMPTHVSVDRHGGAYCTDPWRVVRVSQDGTVTTRCGYRHNPINSNWHGGSGSAADSASVRPTLELVGDWSAIPPERHGFHEIWGMAFDLDSVSVPRLDTDAPTQVNPIDGAIEHPHLDGPRQFIADTQNNRICLLTYPRNSFTAPPVVTEFLTGLADPWAVLWDDGKIYVSERLAHRIAVYDATTGAFIKTLVAGPALAGIGTDREVIRYTSDMTLMRSHDVVAPEGMVIQDGWLYYASWAMRQVKRVHLTTGVVEVVVPNVIDDFNANYMQIAISDGTFGPRGTIFIWTWSIAKFGFPFVYLPDGVSTWSLMTQSSSSRRGKGGAWDSLSYGAAGGVGAGRLWCGHAGGGLMMITKALPTDPTINRAMYVAGETAYEQHRLRNGSGGYDLYGDPPPFGESAELDYYLTWCGIQP